jgi:hypothetical protein
VAREQDFVQDYLAQARSDLGRRFDLDQLTFTGQQENSLNGGAVEGLVDPGSLREDVETNVCAGSGAKDPRAAGRLDEIVFLIEGCVDGKGNSPWRRR